MGNARIHSMDALRASSMLLLVPVHAAVFLAINGHQGAWSTALYWMVHVFRLPLFFAMSGFFLALMLGRRGLGGTVRNRSARIVLPMLLGLVTVVPVMLLIAEWTGTEMSPSGSLPAPLALEPSFLWFLWYLLIVDTAAIALFLAVPAIVRAAGRGMRTAISRPLVGIALLAVPTALALWPAQSWMADPRPTTWVPEPAALAYYALFFGLGAALFAHRELVSDAGRHAWRWFACALAATLPAGVLYSLHNSPQLGTTPVVHGAALLIYAIATWTSLIALVGLAHRYLDRPRPALRYLADSSYWIYLSHLPALILAMALAGSLALGTGPGFVLVTAAALAFSLITYPLFVRYTVIGRVLNGPRARPRDRPVPAVRSGSPAAEPST